MELQATTKMEELSGKKGIESIDDIPQVYFAVKDVTKSNYIQSEENSAIFLEK